MKHHGIAAMVLLLSLGAASGQQGQPTTAQSTAVAQTPSPSHRSSYDPMAGGRATAGQPKGIVETTLAGVNPQNKDYGSVIADWRKEVFEATLSGIYLWSIFILCVLLGGSLLGNGWLFRERQRRLVISANIVVQLYNAYIGSRAKSLDVISKHNALVERYNRLSDEKCALQLQLGGGKNEGPASEMDFDMAKRDKGVEQNARLAEPPFPVHEDEPEEVDPAEADVLRGQLKDLETKLQRKDAQLQAKENAITNLRSRLARAHDSLEGQRLQKSGMK